VRTVTVFALLAAALVVSAAAGILVGAVAIAPGDVLSALFGAEGTNGTIIRELRLPRVLGAALVGAALAAAGALLQGMLRNPLADPFVTGTSAGASLGAVLAVALGFEPALVPVAAFGGAMAAIALVWRLARLGGRTTILTVLLAGVVLTSFAGALVTFILVSSDRLSLRLRAVLGWLQGGISVISWNELAVVAIVVAIGIIGAVLLAPRIDAYAFGEETAAALGIDLDRTTALVLAYDRAPHRRRSRDRRAHRLRRPRDPARAPVPSRRDAPPPHRREHSGGRDRARARRSGRAHRARAS
jgi:iron complex transport system permease protein